MSKSQDTTSSSTSNNPKQEQNQTEEDEWEEEEHKCNMCDKTENLMRCSGCKTVYYCGKVHQRNDWISHKVVCQAVQKAQAEVKEKERKAAGLVAPSEDEKLPPKEDEDETGEAFDDGEKAICGNHTKAERNQYVHALNNMAGRHNIDMPLARYEMYAIENEKWKPIKEDERLPNGLIIHKGSTKKRSEGPIGSAVFVKGSVTVGIAVASGKDIIVQFDGTPEPVHKIEEAVKIGEHIVASPGAFVDGACVIHGPLKYHGVDIDANGGVHYSGSAFRADGKRKEEGSFYHEICVEVLSSSNAPKQ